MPIPATTKPHRLEENIGAADPEIASADLDEIDQAAARIRVQGHRYSEVHERMIDR